MEAKVKINALRKPDSIVEEIALAEINEFLLFHNDFDEELVNEINIKKEYPQIVRSIKKGLIVFDEEQNPTYTLAFPLNPESEFTVTEVKFKTRIKPSTLKNLSKGMDVMLNQMEFKLKSLSHITGLTFAQLDNLNQHDYKTIDQMSSNFF